MRASRLRRLYGRRVGPDLAVLAAAPPPPAGHTAARLDGTATVIRGGALTGAADGKQFCCVIRLSVDNDDTIYALVNNDSDTIRIQRTTNDRIFIDLAGVLSVNTATDILTEAHGTVTLFISVNAAAGSQSLIVYRDSTDITPSSTITESDVDWTDSNWFLFVTDTASGHLVGDVELVWLDNSYIDFSNSVARDSFASPSAIAAAGYQPPLVYMTGSDLIGAGAESISNNGTGGNFARSGTIAAA